MGKLKMNEPAQTYYEIIKNLIVDGMEWELGIEANMARVAQYFANEAETVRTQAMLDTLRIILDQTPKGRAIKKSRLEQTIKQLEIKLTPKIVSGIDQ